MAAVTTEIPTKNPVESSQPASWKIDNAVRQLAYRYWVERGRPIGSPEVDWYRAEQKIRTVMLDHLLTVIESYQMDIRNRAPRVQELDRAIELMEKYTINPADRLLTWADVVGRETATVSR